MSDLIERLRRENSLRLTVGQDFSDLLLDAADEIERLRARLAEADRTLRQLRQRLIEVNAGSEMGNIDSELVATIDVYLRPSDSASHRETGNE